MVELAGLRVCEACDGTYNQLKICYCAEVNVDDVDTHLYCWYLMSDIWRRPLDEVPNNVTELLYCLISLCLCNWWTGRDVLGLENAVFRFVCECYSRLPQQRQRRAVRPQAEKRWRNWLVIFDLNDASLLLAFAAVCALLDRPTRSIQKCYISIYQLPTIKCTRCSFFVLFLFY